MEAFEDLVRYDECLYEDICAAKWLCDFVEDNEPTDAVLAVVTAAQTGDWTPEIAALAAVIAAGEFRNVDYWAFMMPSTKKAMAIAKYVAQTGDIKALACPLSAKNGDESAEALYDLLNNRVVFPDAGQHKLPRWACFLYGFSRYVCTIPVRA